MLGKGTAKDGRLFIQDGLQLQSTTTSVSTTTKGTTSTDPWHGVFPSSYHGDIHHYLHDPFAVESFYGESDPQNVAAQ